MGCGPSFDSQALRKDRTIPSLKARLALQVCDLCSLPGPWIYTNPTLNWMLCCCSLEIVDNFFKQGDLPFYFSLVWKWFCPNVSILPPKARKAFCPDNSFWLHNLKSLLYHSTPSHFPVFSFWLLIQRAEGEYFEIQVLIDIQYEKKKEASSYLPRMASGTSFIISWEYDWIELLSWSCCYSQFK